MHSIFVLPHCLLFCSVIQTDFFGVIAGIWLFYVSGTRRKIQLMGSFVLCFQYGLCAIWARVSLPFFPFSGWEEPFQSVDKYGMGRSWRDFVLFHGMYLLMHRLIPISFKVA